MSTIQTVEQKAHRAAALKFLNDYYETETQCPYCGSATSMESSGCCGESSAHFEEVYIDYDNEPIDKEEFIANFDEVKELEKYMREYRGVLPLTKLRVS